MIYLHDTLISLGQSGQGCIKRNNIIIFRSRRHGNELALTWDVDHMETEGLVISLLKSGILSVKALEFCRSCEPRGNIACFDNFHDASRRPSEDENFVPIQDVCNE